MCSEDEESIVAGGYEKQVLLRLNARNAGVFLLEILCETPIAPKCI